MIEPGTTARTNWALGAPVTASSVLRDSARAECAVDGDAESEPSRWMSAADDAHPVISIDLPQPIMLEEVRISSGYFNDATATLKDFTVEVHLDGAWTGVGEIRDNNERMVSVAPQSPTTADKIRLSITDPSGANPDVARVHEIEVYGDPPE